MTKGPSGSGRTVRKQSTARSRMGLLCLALCLTALGVWGLQRGRIETAANAALPSAGALAALPAAAGNTPTDREIARWREAAARNEQDERTWTNLGDALMQKARETADSSYYDHAERMFRKSLALKPDDASATTSMAWVCSARHEFEKSIEWANKAVTLDPKNPAAYGLLGDAAVELGDYEAAFEHYQKMMDTRPDLSSYSRGAHLLFLTGDARKGMWLMEKAIRAGGPYAENTAWCRAQLGLMQFQTGNLLAAEQTLAKALQQTPANPHLLAAMGRVKAGRREYTSAIDYYRKAAEVAPQHEALVALGDLYTLTGKPREAEQQYALVETIHTLQKSRGVQGDMQMAQFYADHDRNLPEALRLAEAEYQARKNVYAADTLAWCYYKNGRYEQAKERIINALSQRTPEALFAFHAGMIYAKMGDREAAQKHLYLALSLNPNFSPIFAPIAAETIKQLGASRQSDNPVRSQNH